MPHSSREFRNELTPQEVAEQQAAEIVKQAERAKARILEVPGRNVNSANLPQAQVITRKIVNSKEKGGQLSDLLHSVLVDEEYSAVAAHVDDITRRRIYNNEYVDFARLIPSDKSNEEEEPMEMVNRGGKPAWVPRKENTAITSFHRWEQAFRVFSNIYTEFYPNKAAELIQYNYVINTASQSFTWDNVYKYDKDFRRHISKFPTRSWALILQFSWNLRLRDRHCERYGNNNNDHSQNNSGNRSRGKRENCWKFNTGKCTYGLSCKFDHWCALCFKFGHGAHNCRQVKGNADVDREDRTDRRDRSGGQDKHFNRNDRFHFFKKEEKGKK